jgi:hypothetical protein
MAAFVTNEEFFVAYDWRWVAKQVLDGVSASSSAAPPGLAELQSTSTPAGSVVYTLIQQASDLVLAAATIGGRYSPDDVSAYGGTLLKRITCDLTMGLVLKRRAMAMADLEKLFKPYAEALEYLELLRRGERIFYAVPGVTPEAGIPSTASMLPQPGVNCPIITTQASRYFGNGPVNGTGCC